MRIALTPEAEVELLETLTFYNEKVEGLGDDFNKEFERAIQDITAFPEFWGLVGRGYRRKLMDRFPYGLVYVLRKEQIMIVAVMHTSRKPGYWLKDNS